MAKSTGPGLCHLKDPSNPLRLPKQLRFRFGEPGSCNGVFLADKKFSHLYSPYIYTSYGLAVINDLRLVIERFFGRFAALYRFFLSRTWAEHNHQAEMMVYAAVNLTNYRTMMPVNPECPHDDPFCGHDPLHLCTAFCVHNELVWDYLGRQTFLAPPTPVETRDILSRHWLAATITPDELILDVEAGNDGILGQLNEDFGVPFRPLHQVRRRRLQEGRVRPRRNRM